MKRLFLISVFCLGISHAEVIKGPAPARNLYSKKNVVTVFDGVFVESFSKVNGFYRISFFCCVDTSDAEHVYKKVNENREIDITLRKNAVLKDEFGREIGKMLDDYPTRGLRKEGAIIFCGLEDIEISADAVYPESDVDAAFQSLIQNGNYDLAAFIKYFEANRFIEEDWKNDFINYTTYSAGCTIEPAIRLKAIFYKNKLVCIIDAGQLPNPLKYPVKPVKRYRALMITTDKLVEKDVDYLYIRPFRDRY